MLDRLVELVIQFVDLFFFTRVVDQWERGIVLRFGKLARKVKPGLRFVAPFGIERLLLESVYARPAVLESQSLTTADGVSVVITPIVLFQVRDAAKLLLKSGGQEEAVVDAVAGVVTAHVTGAKWADLTTDEFRATVVADAAANARVWGIDIRNITWKDLVQTPTYRLIQETNHK